MKITPVSNSVQLLKLLIVLFFLPVVSFSYEKMIHIHVNNLNSFYKNMNNNKVFNKVNKSKNWSTFKYSKLYVRLFDDIKKIDSDNKILNFKNIEKLPNGSMDFYLINIEKENFIAKIKLEKSQVATLINIDFDKLESTMFLGKKIYKYQKIQLVLDNDYLYLSNNLKYLKAFFENKNNSNTDITLKNKYKNFIYINLKKIKGTPYLNNYWFTNLKDFSNFESIIVQFNLTQTLFEENGIISLKNEENNMKKLKIIDKKFKITLFDSRGKFRISPFLKNKNINIYSVVSNDFKSKVYLAKYIGKKSFKDFLKTISPSAKIIKNELLEYHYGLMNRKVVYIKIIDKNLLFSNNIKLLSDIKLKENNNLYQKIEISDFKNISEELLKISKLDKNNYSYNSFLKSYLLNYMNIKYFKYDSSFKDNNKLEFNTKIIF